MVSPHPERYSTTVVVVVSGRSVWRRYVATVVNIQKWLRHAIVPHKHLKFNQSGGKKSPAVADGYLMQLAASLETATINSDVVGQAKEVTVATSEPDTSC